jgi:hypothetical protein
MSGPTFSLGGQQRRIHISCSAGTPTKIADAENRLTSSGRRRIAEITTGCGNKMGTVMDELGRKRLDASIGNAITVSSRTWWWHCMHGWTDTRLGSHACRHVAVRAI